MLLSVVLGLVLGLIVGALVTYALMVKRTSRLQSELEVVRQFKELDAQRLARVEEEFRDAFQALAQEILEAKAESFSHHNARQLQAILEPLRDRIREFQAKVEETHTESMAKIQFLEHIGLSMSQEAERLAKALKGEVKTQGTWGEVILERILEESGLREGYEYVLQGEGLDLRNQQGNRIRPDVVIRLPQGRHVIVDAKVSLVAYERYVNSSEPEEQAKAGADLVRSIKAHIDGLHSRAYQHQPEMNSPDYVVLFMPLEGALATALSLDPELTSYGWKQGVVLTTPTTLMATLGIIAHLWRQENQQAHALEIARQSGALYDKFVGFVASLEEVGKHIERSQTAYQKAYNQLKTGRGNLIARAEGLRDMGAAASKRLPDGLVEAALDGDSMHSPVEAEV